MNPLMSAMGIIMCSAMSQAAPAKGDLPAKQTDAVTTDAGDVFGIRVGERRDVDAFKGIPYAAPPVGPLRWKPPQPVRPWNKRFNGQRPCVQFEKSCPQPRAMMGTDSGSQSEDCLYLNVWTTARRSDKRPVMVWIHGGGFTTGSGSLPFYNGEHLARQGVVVVTINYRLGPFGFFAHPLLSKESERHVSGNYGLLDMIAALQWVRRNIAAFGGDPGCVTIFGESAGAAAVSRLMVCPPARGLFHRAIAESGGAYGRNRHLRETWYGMESMEKSGERLTAELGCDKAADPLKALRGKTADEILAAANPAQGLFGKGMKYGPVVDGWLLPDDPGALWEAGRQFDVPFLTGTNADEGTIFLQQLAIKRPVGYRLTVHAMFREEADELLRLFPANSEAEVPSAMNQLVTVMAFAAPARAEARAMHAVKSPAYLYQFTRKPKTALPNRRGTFHAMEIPYVFGTLPRVGAGDEDRRLSQRMMSYWIHFARSGNPNGKAVDGAPLPKWPRYDAKGDSHLELGDDVRAQSGLFKQACDALARMQTARMASRAQATQPARRVMQAD